MPRFDLLLSGPKIGLIFAQRRGLSCANKGNFDRMAGPDVRVRIRGGVVQVDIAGPHKKPVVPVAADKRTESTKTGYVCAGRPILN